MAGEFDDIRSRLEAISEELADLSIQRLTESIDAGGTELPVDEKRLADALEQPGATEGHVNHDGDAALDRFATTLEKVCVDTVEAGFMTKDLALLVGETQSWLSTTGFLDKVGDNLGKAMA